MLNGRSRVIALRRLTLRLLQAQLRQQRKPLRVRLPQPQLLTLVSVTAHALYAQNAPIFLILEFTRLSLQRLAH